MGLRVGLRVGVTLPQFSRDPGAALAVARRAEERGLDGVFVFDHLWAPGQPGRPALHGPTLLGALAATTSTLTLGTLVARVGLLPDAVLVQTLVTLARMAGGRFVAGLGVGDRASRAENQAAGVPFRTVAERVASLEAVTAALRAEGVTTWVGGLSPVVLRAAAGGADGWNGWGQPVGEWARAAATVLSQAGRPIDLSWGGQVLVGRTAAEAAAKLAAQGDRPGLVHGVVDDLAAHFRALADGGAAWAVCASLDHDVELVAEAASLLRRPNAPDTSPPDTSPPDVCGSDGARRR